MVRSVFRRVGVTVGVVWTLGFLRVVVGVVWEAYSFKVGIANEVIIVGVIGMSRVRVVVVEVV